MSRNTTIIKNAPRPPICAILRELRLRDGVCDSVSQQRWGEEEEGRC
jgi:hypothetical protein